MKHWYLSPRFWLTTATLAVAAFAFTLLFEISFLRLAHERFLETPDNLPIVFILVPLGGILGSTVGLFTVKLRRLTGLICASFAFFASGAVMAALGAGHTADAGAGLASLGAGLLLVTLGATIHRMTGSPRLPTTVSFGISTGIAVAHFPMFFHAPSSTQAYAVCIACAIGMLLVFLHTVEEAAIEPPSGGGKSWITYTGLVVLLCISVCLDTAYNFTALGDFQMRKMAWVSDTQLWILAGVHLLTGIAVWRVLVRGRVYGLMTVILAIMIAQVVVMPRVPQLAGVFHVLTAIATTAGAIMIGYLCVYSRGWVLVPKAPMRTGVLVIAIVWIAAPGGLMLGLNEYAFATLIWILAMTLGAIALYVCTIRVKEPPRMNFDHPDADSTSRLR